MSNEFCFVCFCFLFVCLFVCFFAIALKVPFKVLKGLLKNKSTSWWKFFSSMESVKFCQVSANEIECRISWKVWKFEFEISWKVSANETKADAGKFRHWNTYYQLRHMASNLIMRTALLPRQWQPLTDVGPFESSAGKSIFLFFVENKAFGEKFTWSGFVST